VDQLSARTKDSAADCRGLAHCGSCRMWWAVQTLHPVAIHRP